MLITKFNRMIRNRLLLAIFAVIVSAAFIGVGALTAWRGWDEQDNGNAVGELFGEKISSKEFFIARFFVLGNNENSKKGRI